MLQFYSEFKKSSQIIYIFQIILISLLFEHLSKSTSFLGFFLKKSDKFFPVGRWRRKKKKDRNFSTKVPAECGDSRLVFHILERHECIRGWKKLKRPRKFIRVPLQGYTMLKIELENTRTIFLTRKKKKKKKNGSSMFAYLTFDFHLIVIIKSLGVQIHLWEHSSFFT